MSEASEEVCDCYCVIIGQSCQFSTTVTVIEEVSARSTGNKGLEVFFCEVSVVVWSQWASNISGKKGRAAEDLGCKWTQILTSSLKYRRTRDFWEGGCFQKVTRGIFVKMSPVKKYLENQWIMGRWGWGSCSKSEISDWGASCRMAWEGWKEVSCS